MAMMTVTRQINYQSMAKEAARDPAAMRAALAEADIAPLLMVLAQFGRAGDLLERAAPHIHGAWSFMEDLPARLKADIRERVADTMLECAHGPDALRPTFDADELRRIFSLCVGQDVPAEYIPLLMEEMQFSDEDSRALKWSAPSGPKRRKNFKVIIIGAGFAGICAAIRLKQAGIPYVVIEKNDAVGGTWYENTYPGCAVDTPNHFFSYSFRPNNDWSRHFSQQPEILDYLSKTAEEYGILGDIRFNREVTGADYDADSGHWTVSMRGAGGKAETLEANAVITCVGQLNRPSIPKLKGLETFKGPVFHTAAWNHSVDLKGKRVAMIGTGASGIQVGPSIAPEAARFTVFQRSPHWIMKNDNYHKSVTEGHRWALRNIPFFTNWNRAQLFWASSDGFHDSLRIDPEWDQPDVSLNAENHQMRERIIAYVREQLDGDEDLIAKVLPSYPPYGKRMLRDNHWFKMLKRDNVELVAGNITEITPKGVVDKDGHLHEADVIIMATGFNAGKILWPMEIRGREGRPIRDIWGDEDPRAYLGISVPEFPNLFVTFGPNTNLAHGGSAVFHFECQVNYIVKALKDLIESDADTLEVRRDVHDDFNRLVDEKCRNMVWSHPGVNNWYKNSSGRVTVTSPWRLVDYWQLTHDFKPEEYLFGTAGEGAVNKTMAEVK
ncbi:NAD(P)/FAD-dependent oxidoreductase [Martelella sp. FLE1502]